MSEGRQSGLMHSRPLLEMHVLRQEAEPQAFRAHYVAAIRRLFAANQAKDSRFARAVATDEADVLARIDLHGRAPQDILRAVRFMHI
jgi:hypothetical protein